MPIASPDAALACPRCATPLVTLSGAAAVGSLSVQCTRCGHWVQLGRPGGAFGPPAHGPGPGGGAAAPGRLGGTLEILGLAAAFVGALALGGLGLAQGMFRPMLAELGGEPPALTAFMLATRFPFVLAAVVLGLEVAALVIRLRGGTQGRWLVGAALALVLVGAPLCIVSLYLPLFTLAGAIK